MEERLTFFSPDEDIPEANNELAEAGEEVATAAVLMAEAETPEELSQAESRLRAAEARLASAEQSIVELREMVESRAAADHSHPLPGDLQTVADALAELEEEEHAPERKKWYQRKIFGGRED